jgi:hypothetical protein
MPCRHHGVGDRAVPVFEILMATSGKETTTTRDTETPGLIEGQNIHTDLKQQVWPSFCIELIKTRKGRNFFFNFVIIFKSTHIL